MQTRMAPLPTPPPSPGGDAWGTLWTSPFSSGCIAVECNVFGQHVVFVHPPPPPCDIPSGCSFFTGPWTVTRSSLRILRRVAAFCRPLRPVLLLVSFPRSRSPVVGVLGLCWLLRGHLTVFAVHTPPLSGCPQPASLCFRVREAQVPWSSTRCPGRPPRTLPQSVGCACAGRIPCWLRVACASRVACAPSWLTRVVCVPQWCLG